MAGVGPERNQAISSFIALTVIMHCPELSSDEVTDIEDTLARMQGVRRLSVLLCPTFLSSSGNSSSKEMKSGTAC